MISTSPKCRTKELNFCRGRAFVSCRQVGNFEPGLPALLFEPHILNVDVAESSLKPGVILYYKSDCLRVVAVKYVPTV